MLSDYKAYNVFIIKKKNCDILLSYRQLLATESKMKTKPFLKQFLI